MQHTITLTLVHLITGGRRGHDTHWGFVEYFPGTQPASPFDGPRWSPPADLSETDESIIVEMNLAGIQSHVIRIDMTTRSITVSGSREETSDRQSRVYHMLEIERGSFERVIHVPVPVQPSSAEVGFSEGLLTIRLAKMRDALRHACSLAETTEGFE